MIYHVGISTYEKHKKFNAHATCEFQLNSDVPMHVPFYMHCTCCASYNLEKKNK